MSIWKKEPEKKQPIETDLYRHVDDFFENMN